MRQCWYIFNLQHKRGENIKHLIFQHYYLHRMLLLLLRLLRRRTFMRNKYNFIKKKRF